MCSHLAVPFSVGIRICRSSRQNITETVAAQHIPACIFFIYTRKGERKLRFAYEAHAACDIHGYVMETVVTPGNVRDSVAFDDVYAAA